MKTNKGFANILLIILGLLIVGGGSYVYLNNKEEKSNDSLKYNKESLITELNTSIDDINKNLNFIDNEVEYTINNMTEGIDAGLETGSYCNNDFYEKMMVDLKQNSKNVLEIKSEFKLMLDKHKDLLNSVQSISQVKNEDIILYESLKVDSNSLKNRLDIITDFSRDLFMSRDEINKKLSDC